MIRTRGSAPAAITILILVWQVTTLSGDIPAYLLPPPGDAFRAFATAPHYFLANLAITATETGLGLGLAVVGALAWAVTLSAVPFLHRMIFPLLVAAQATPKEALAPIFILWWGYSLLPKVVLSALVAFFPLLLATMVGLERFTPDHRLLATSMGAGRFKTLVSFRIWVALPSFLGGVRLAITFALLGAILGEYLGSDTGVGYQILSASRRLDGGSLYAGLITLIVMSWLLVRLVDLAEACLLRHGRAR